MIEIPNIVAASLRGQIGVRESQMLSALSEIRSGNVDDIVIRQMEDVIGMLRLLHRVFDPSEYNNEEMSA